MKRKAIYLFAILVALAAPAFAQMTGDWKLYPSFNNYHGSYANTFVEKLIDTPKRVYIQYKAQAQHTAPSAQWYYNKYTFLYVYDKDADELLHYSKRNYLSDNIIASMAYNKQNGYLLVVYDDSNIDLIFDNGEVKNISGLASATMNESRKINEICFDPANNKVYLGTEFGFIVLDDKKKEISESRNYRTSLRNVGRIGDFLVVFKDNAAYVAPASGSHLTFDEFTPISLNATPSQLLPLNGNKFAYVSGNKLYVATLADDGTVASNAVKVNEKVTMVSPSAAGWSVCGAGNVYELALDGSIKSAPLAQGDNNKKYASRDFRNFWVMNERKGLSGKKLDGTTWTVTHGDIAPNAPATFHTDQIMYNDTYGMLLNSHGVEGIFTFTTMQYPVHISALKDGTWRHYGPIETYPSQASSFDDPNNMVVDPDDDKYVYMGAFKRGLLRLNLEDPADVLHMSQPGDAGKNLPGFVPIVPTDTWASYCRFSGLTFDADGNLWAMHHTNGEADDLVIYVWPAQYRRSGTAQDKWIKYVYPAEEHNYNSKMLALQHPSNKNLLVLSANHWDAPIIIVDTKGTIDNQSDDTVTHMIKVTDQDGNVVNKNKITQFYEDPATGNVWVLSTAGVFWFNPREAQSNPSLVNRIKVARNDGTNLADYLLDNILVQQMTSDAAGRKWFATEDAGVVCTSADGKEVLAEFTTDNSYIPANIVFGIGYNKATNSIMVSTERGLAEFFPSGSVTSEDMDNLKVYPNPVRPDYLGWITVTGLPDNSVVKIVDAQGNIVKELGFSSGGSVKWDATNMENKRVRSGVYYVLAGSGPGDSSVAKNTKILVVN